MLNRYARIEAFKHVILSVTIQRYGRDNHMYGFGDIANPGKRQGISMSSANRLKQIVDSMQKTQQGKHSLVYEWQPPTLHLIPYQCSYCNEIVWSTNPNLEIKCCNCDDHCSQWMVRKS